MDHSHQHLVDLFWRNDKADTGRVIASAQKPTAGYAASDFLNRIKIGSITDCFKYQGIKTPGNEKKR